MKSFMKTLKEGVSSSKTASTGKSGQGKKQTAATASSSSSTTTSTAVVTASSKSGDPAPDPVVVPDADAAKDPTVMGTPDAAACSATSTTTTTTGTNVADPVAGTDGGDPDPALTSSDGDKGSPDPVSNHVSSPDAGDASVIDPSNDSDPVITTTVTTADTLTDPTPETSSSTTAAAADDIKESESAPPARGRESEQQQQPDPVTPSESCKSDIVHESGSGDVKQEAAQPDNTSVSSCPYGRELESKYGLQKEISSRLSQLFSSGKLTITDLDDRAIDALKEYGNMDAVLLILDEFEGSNLEHVNNKSAFLCGLMKTHRQKDKAFKQQQQQHHHHHHYHKVSFNPNDPHGKDHHALHHMMPNGFLTSNPAAGSAVHAHAGSGDASTGASGTTMTTTTTTPPPGPDEAALKAILDRTGYTLDVTSGQRKYGGPPPDWDESVNDPPGAGCEIFVGKIPKEMFEDELIPVFEQIGRIWDLRLMIDPIHGYNRGFAFITYCNKDDANTAQVKLDGYEIRKGKSLKVNVSVPNLRLFVGNIPKSKSKSEIMSEFAKLTTGLNEVIVYSSPDDRKKNRGFCFLEYESHKSASLAKRKLSTGRTKVWGCDILVDWADPQEEPDQETMERVKVLYVRNLVTDVTEDELKEVFAAHGFIERVKKIKDYAFIHFEDRDSAVKAMINLQDHEIRGVRINISLAKPPSDRKKKEEILRNRERRVTMMMQQRSLITGITGMPPLSNLSPGLHHPHLPPHVSLSHLPNGSSSRHRSSKGTRPPSYPMTTSGLPAAAAASLSSYRPVPPYHPASAWPQVPDWLPYAAGYPANWNWAYNAPGTNAAVNAAAAGDPRSSSNALAAAAAAAAHAAAATAGTPAGPAAAQYARSMAAAAAAAGITGSSLPASHHPHHHPHPHHSSNSRHQRSLWTPNPAAATASSSTGNSSSSGNNNSNNSSINNNPAAAAVVVMSGGPAAAAASSDLKKSKWRR